MLSRDEILEEVRRFALRHEVFSNEIRIIIYSVIVYLGYDASWTEIKEGVEKVLKKSINPNLLAFHLRRMVDAGIIDRIERGREIRYVLKDKSFEKNSEQVIKKLKKVFERG